ncbi:MAG: hypothetical protein CL489_10790 [Acidobacteria bacterium]|nr:hypothetical protein [Acidobacteriota bacterium]|tara:strand:- start:4077 stop:4427 length:351 start_codon:yes stop_codon:yes gene_type:complete
MELPLDICIHIPKAQEEHFFNDKCDPGEQYAYWSFSRNPTKFGHSSCIWFKVRNKVVAVVQTSGITGNDSGGIDIWWRPENVKFLNEEEQFDAKPITRGFYYIDPVKVKLPNPDKV